MATRDDVLAQIRSLPLEDREYIEAELVRDADGRGAYADPSPLVEEMIRRAEHALAHPEDGVSRADAVADARAAVAAARSRTP